MNSFHGEFAGTVAVDGEFDVETHESGERCVGVFRLPSDLADGINIGSRYPLDIDGGQSITIRVTETAPSSTGRALDVLFSSC